MKAIMISLALFGALSLAGCAGMYKGGCGSCQKKCECKKECCEDGSCEMKKSEDKK